MAFKIVDCDNVRENFSSTGTTITLGGAVANSRAFAAVLSNGDTFFGVARKGAEVSIGLFTYTASGGTVAQTTVWYSTNGNSAVSFSTGAGEIFFDAPSRLFDFLNMQEITVVSAATTDIGAAQGSNIAISGTTGPITSFGTAKNKLRIVRHSGSVITHNATSLILKSGANRTTIANDIGIYISDNSGNWRELLYDPATAAREILTANRTYYVRTDGSNSNTGLANTAGGAFLTIQKALDVVAALDISTFTVTIQVGAGSYTGGASVSAPWVGSGIVILQGDNTTPSNVVISTTSADGIVVRGGGRLSVSGFKIVTTTSGYALHVVGGSISVLSKMEYGACAQFHILSESYGSIIHGSITYTISGSATVHAIANGGALNLNGCAVTLTGTPAFAAGFAYATRVGFIEAASMTFGGAATGPRYFIDTNGVIYTSGGGATYFPGNAGGTALSGGQYV